MTFGRAGRASLTHRIPQPYGSHRSSLLFGIGLLCTSLALAAGFRGSPLTRGIGLTILTIVLASAVLRHERRKAGFAGTASPISLYFLFWAAFVFVAGLGAFGGASLDPRLLQGGTSIVKAYDAALISLILVSCGYYAVTRHSTLSQGLAGDHTVRLSKPVLLLVLVLGWIARLIRFQQGSFGYLGYATAAHTGVLSRGLQLLDGLLPLALVVIGIQLFRRSDSEARTFYRTLLIGNIFALAVTSIGSGVKGQLLTDILPLGILYLFCRGRPPAKTMALLMLLIVIEYGGVQSFRADVQHNQVADASRHGILPAAQLVAGNIRRSWTSMAPIDHFRQAWNGVSTEYAGTVRTLAIILQNTPLRVPFLGPKRIIASAIVFLPSRSIGGSGSVTDIGSYVNTTYLQGGPHSSAPPTQPGDFFISGGWPILIVGEFGVGIALGLTWRTVSRAKTRRSVVFYALAAATFANAGLDCEAIIRTLLQYVIVYGPLIILIFPTDPRQGSPRDRLLP